VQRKHRAIEKEVEKKGEKRKEKKSRGVKGIKLKLQKASFSQWQKAIGDQCSLR